MKRTALALTFAAFVGVASAQEPNPTQTNLQPPGPNGSEPLFKVEVTSRSIPAVNFAHRMGTTYVDLRGTSLMPESSGKVRVDANTGATKMHIDTQKMAPPSTFGPQYTTFVLWAITPEGNAKNLGELVMKGGGDKTQLDATTAFSAYGLIVTAEPYWAVSQPSDVVVMENMIRQDTTGTIETVNAKFELLQRGVYVQNVSAERLAALTTNPGIDLELREAREALAIARAQGADHFAPDVMQKAMTDMQNAEGFQIGGHNMKELETSARAATEEAEDARLISIRKEQADALAAERQREADARASAEAHAADEAARAQAANAQAQQAQSDALAAQHAREEAERLRAEAEQAKEQAMHDRQQAEQEAAAAKAAAQQAQSQQEVLRARLLAQFNAIMQTRDTARGLILNMSDVLFDFGKATLRPEAREKLAKLSGILLAYPTLHVQIEGYTDSIGSDQFNQVLSEKRAFGVRDYVVAQSVNGNNLNAVGYGKSNPIASNDTAEGRQQNRRVQLVVSGDIIGTPIAPGPTTQLQPNGQPMSAPETQPVQPQH